MIGLDDVKAAAERLQGQVRRTPMIEASSLKADIAADFDLRLKLELLQVTGSFKARGATNKLLTTPKETLAKGLVAASGGNHGLATARAGNMAGVHTTIFLPSTVTPAKVEKLKAWGVDTVITGKHWDESNAAALEFVAKTGAAYFHPFADPFVVAGQGTVALEILEQFPDVETVLVAMGGGGLISGIGTAIKALKPNVRVVGIEAAGSPVLLRGLEAGHNVALDSVTTIVATMACAKTTDDIYDTVKRTVDEIVLVEDEEMREASKWLWFEMGLAADLSGAAAIAAIRQGRVRIKPGEKVCAIICGAGPDGIAA